MITWGSGETLATSHDGDYQLSWGSVTDASRYEVRERTADDQPWSSVSCSDPSASSCDISGKAVGASYSYGVRACLSASGDANCGDWTVDANLVSVSIPGLDAPTAPQFASGVTTSVSHSASYRLSWPSVIGAAAYKLQESRDSASWTTVATQTNTQYEVSGRDYGHDYRYRVQTCASFEDGTAGNCGNWSTASASVDITLPQLNSVTLPTSPISSSSAYKVSWTHPTSVGSGSYQIPASEVSYELEESTDTSFSGATTRMVPGNPNCQSVGGTGFECSFDPATKSGRTYYYRVKLLRSGSSSSWRASVGGIAVSWWPSVNLARSEATDINGSYNVTWSNPGSTYNLSLQEKVSGDIYQADGSATTNEIDWSNVASIVTTSGSRSFTGKAGHATYAYRSRLCRDDDASICNGVWSSQSEVNLYVVLPSPTGLTIPDVNNFTYGGDYTVEWNSGGTYSVATRTYTLKETLPGASPTAISVSSLSTDPTARYASGSYAYAVASCTSVGCTPYTASTSLVIQDLSAPSLTDNGDQEYYNGQFQLDWTQVFADAYTGTRRYQLQDGDSNDIVLSSLGATDHSFGSPPLGSGSYSYKVRACATSEADKCSPWSSTLNISVRDLDLSGLSLSSDDGHVSDDGIYTISWNGVAEATNYTLLENGTPTSCTGTSIRSCLFSDKSDDNSFDYKVKACAGSRCFESAAYTVAVNFEIEISDCAGLNNVRNNLSGKYKLTENISNASCVTSPIGTDATPFTGTFNGAGHTISNLTISLSSTNYVGLFGKTGSGARIKNVSLVGANISGNGHVGGLVGLNSSGSSITNSYITGTVTGQSDFVGGLVGVNSGRITNNYITGTVTGQSDFVGGLVGVNHGTITNGYMTDTVIGQSTVGGLVGSNTSGSISNSYAAKVVTGQSSVGGFVGSNSGTISGTNYFVDNDGGSNGVGTGSCSGCTRKTLGELAQATSASGWTSANWDFGTTSQLPALKYTNDSDTSEIECGGDTGVNCGQLLSGQPVSLSAQTISCEGRGGVTHVSSQGQEICEFAGTSCPSGWRQSASNWSATTARTCSDRTSCTTGSHMFGETSPETCSYRRMYARTCSGTTGGGKDNPPRPYTYSCPYEGNASCSATTTHVGCILNNTCAGIGGVIVTSGGQEICKVAGTSCPSGWIRDSNWSTTTARTCSDRTSCTTGSHMFGETSPETCSYRRMHARTCSGTTGGGKDNPPRPYTYSCPYEGNASCSATTTHVGCALNNTCAGIGGVIVTSGGQEICKIAGSSASSCPSGWRYLDWSTTAARTCSDRTSCTTGSHMFGETSPETCSYRRMYARTCSGTTGGGKDNPPRPYTYSCPYEGNASCSATMTYVGCGRNW